MRWGMQVMKRVVGVAAARAALAGARAFGQVQQPPAKLAQGTVEQLVRCENAYRRVHGSAGGATPYVENESPHAKAAWAAIRATAHITSVRMRITTPVFVD